MRRLRVAGPLSEGKKRAFNTARLPDPIRIGEILTDVKQNRWKLGRSIGVGGFGEIYLASDDISKPVGSDAKYVIKVEPHNNGPLFVEMNFYVRAAKEDTIEEWMKQQGLSRLGMPRFIALGSHVYKGMRYRFLVLDRFSQDLNKLFLRNGRTFHIKTAFTLAIQILDALEYVHSRGYVHSDVKHSNLLLDASGNQVYLLDYGLASHYVDSKGRHKAYGCDERKAHNGTVEFASRDAHIGAASRRGDLEILAYNLLQWLCGRLPWEMVESADDVHELKKQLMGDTSMLMRICFPGGAPDAVRRFVRYVATLEFEARPDYARCRAMLRQGIRDAGFLDDGLLEFDNPDNIRRAKKPKKRKKEPENESPVKRQTIVAPRSLPRMPCVVQNFNRQTRNTAASPCTKSCLETFSWEAVLSSNPELGLKKRRKSAPAPVPIEPPPATGTARLLTHAMRDVIARRWPSAAPTARRSKPGVMSPVGGAMTPAMQDVIARRWRWSVSRSRSGKKLAPAARPRGMVLRSRSCNREAATKEGEAKTGAAVARKVSLRRRES